MSKSKGNFLTVKDCIKEYGADATRISMADAGDSLDDANFERTTANAAILKLFAFEKWMHDTVKHLNLSAGIDFAATSEYDNADKIFENELNGAIANTDRAYAEMKMKVALQKGFYELQSLKEEYSLMKKGAMNPHLVMRFIEASLKMLNPICPHFCQHEWSTVYLPILKVSKNAPAEPDIINDAGWPKVSAEYQQIFNRMYTYLKHVKH